MFMRPQWSCPDLSPPAREYPLVIPGSDEEFDCCPTYYLRTAGMGLPAEHLVEGAIHPAQIVSEWAMEVESGARQVESLPPKGRELVHVFLSQKQQRDEHDRKEREKARARK